MKKIIIAYILLLSLSLTACGNVKRTIKVENTTTQEDSSLTEEPENLERNIDEMILDNNYVTVTGIKEEISETEDGGYIYGLLMEVTNNVGRELFINIEGISYNNESVQFKKIEYVGKNDFARTFANVPLDSCQDIGSIKILFTLREVNDEIIRIYEAEYTPKISKAAVDNIEGNNYNSEDKLIVNNEYMDVSVYRTKDNSITYKVKNNDERLYLRLVINSPDDPDKEFYNQIVIFPGDVGYYTISEPPADVEVRLYHMDKNTNSMEEIGTEAF